jgi:hypothetical protein
MFNVTAAGLCHQLQKEPFHFMFMAGARKQTESVQGTLRPGDPAPEELSKKNTAPLVAWHKLERCQATCWDHKGNYNLQLWCCDL